MVQLLKTSASAIYRGGVAVRELLYRKSLIPVQQLEHAAVISVGNIRSGGSGKTPVAMFLASLLDRLSIPTTLLFRGYKGSMEYDGGAVTPGKSPGVSWRQCGDEAFMAARQLRGVSVRCGADRYEQAQLTERDGARVILLDDGFQHFRLHRDLDLVLCCPEDLDPHTALLPSGPLREPIHSLNRAHLIAGLFEDWQYRADRPQVLFDIEPQGWIDQQLNSIPLNTLRHRRAQLFCGIERGHRFVNSVRRTGQTIVGEAFYPDHHVYTPADLEQILRIGRNNNAEIYCTTAKDLARLSDQPFTAPLYAMKIVPQLTSGRDVMINHLQQALEKKGITVEHSALVNLC